MIGLYRKTATQPMFPWTPDLPMVLVSISAADVDNGSPKLGDMIAYNPEDYGDRWLIAADYFNSNYEFVTYLGDIK